MGSEIPFPQFKHRFERHGITFKRGSKHWKMIGEVDGVYVVYPFPVHKNRVADYYQDGARKRFHLTPKHGISDKAFLKK